MAGEVPRWLERRQHEPVRPRSAPVRGPSSRRDIAKQTGSQLGKSPSVARKPYQPRLKPGSGPWSIPSAGTRLWLPGRPRPNVPGAAYKGRWVPNPSGPGAFAGCPSHGAQILIEASTDSERVACLSRGPRPRGHRRRPELRPHVCDPLPQGQDRSARCPRYGGGVPARRLPPRPSALRSPSGTCGAACWSATPSSGRARAISPSSGPCSASTATASRPARRRTLSIASRTCLCRAACARCSRRLRWRGLETGSRRTYTGTKLETADTAKGSLRGTAPVLDPTLLRTAAGRPGVRDPSVAPARLAAAGATAVRRVLGSRAEGSSDGASRQRRAGHWRRAWNWPCYRPGSGRGGCGRGRHGPHDHRAGGCSRRGTGTGPPLASTAL